LIGGFTGRSIGSGSNNTYLGYLAGKSTTIGNFNTFLGASAGEFHSEGDKNVAIGFLAAQNITTGSDNIFIGTSSGEFHGAGDNNIAIGPFAGRNIQTGFLNTFIGRSSGENNSTGYANTTYGAFAGQQITDGYQNTYLGHQAGLSDTVGFQNVAIGQRAGDVLRSGYGNVFIGSGANGTQTINKAIAIGYNALALADNQIVIGDANTFVIDNYNVGIGINAPQAKLHILGDIIAEKQSKMRAYIGAGNQNIPSSSYEQVSLDGITFDELGEFNTSSYQFIAQKSGYYWVSANITWAGSVDSGVYELQVTKNGSSVLSHSHPLTSNASSDLSLSISDIITLSAGEKIELSVYQDSGNTQSLKTGAQSSSLSIYKLP
jgi:hypothetical protein